MTGSYDDDCEWSYIVPDEYVCCGLVSDVKVDDDCAAAYSSFLVGCVASSVCSSG